MSSKVRRRCTASSQSPRVLSLLVSALLVLALAAVADPPPAPPCLALAPQSVTALPPSSALGRGICQVCPAAPPAPLTPSEPTDLDLWREGDPVAPALYGSRGPPPAGRVGRERAVGRTAGRPDCGLRRLRWLQLLAYWAVVSFPKSGGHGASQQSRSARGDLGVRGRARDFCFFPVRGFFWFARGPLCHYGGSR